ncbi:MAG: family 10 glycosylhydrolase, partial [Bacteroidota bacterium]
EIRDYLVRVALEIVRRYDVDGINFDFIRYPGKNFPDAETFHRYGYGMERDDWRRSNIDKFVTAFYDSAMRIKPMLKIGSAPLGVFSNGSGGNGWGAFYSYYQDSQGWLRKKKHDYLSPQLYWDLGATKDDPDFAELLRKWRAATSGRHIWAGIAAYKPEVMRELARQIDSSRAIGAEGEAYFRYEHVSDATVFRGRYATLANIPPMPWKDPIPPLPPTDLAVTETAPNVFHLEWFAPPVARDGDRAMYYNIYRSTSGQIQLNDPSLLAAITTTNSTFFVDTVRAGSGYRYYYAVSALDKGNNESDISNVASVTMRELTELRGKLSDFTTLSTSVAHDGEATTLIAYKLATRASVLLQVIEQQGDSSTLTLASGMQNAGTFVVGVVAGQLHPGSYIVRLKAGTLAIEQPIEIPR